MKAPGLYPLGSNMFFRLASPVHGNEYNETQKGEKYGAWFCGGCAGRWSHCEDMQKRLLVSRCYADKTHAFVAYCNGRLSSRDYQRGKGWRPAFEIQIQILKAARLLEKIAIGSSQSSS